MVAINYNKNSVASAAAQRQRSATPKAQGAGIQQQGRGFMSGFGGGLGQAAGSVIGNIVGSSGGGGTSTNTNNNWQWDEYQDEFKDWGDQLANSNIGQMEGVNVGDYMENMKDIYETVGNQYLGAATGEGVQDRWDALQDLNASAAASTQQALGGTLNEIGLGAAGTGTANSSRRGVMEGVAASNAGTALQAQMAAQNQAFLDKEQEIRAGGVQGLMGMANQVKDLAQFEQQLKSQSWYQDLMNNNPAAAQALLFQMTMGGLANMSTSSSTTTEQEATGIWDWFS